MAESAVSVVDGRIDIVMPCGGEGRVGWRHVEDCLAVPSSFTTGRMTGKTAEILPLKGITNVSKKFGG